jgi:hypothetical protein
MNVQESYFNARCNTPPNFRDYIQLKQKSDFTLPYFTLLYYIIKLTVLNSPELIIRQNNSVSMG